MTCFIIQSWLHLSIRVTAAFDIIDHNILLNRLENDVGISEIAWLKLYLSDCYQCVAVN